jgi:hypothetical protein
MTPKSTPRTPTNDVADEDNDLYPSQEKDVKKRTHHFYTAIMETTGEIYTNQTGRFIFPSSNGNNYIVICYDYDSMLILAAYKKTHATRLCKAGLRPQLQCLDNQCSEKLKEYMHSKEVDQIGRLSTSPSRHPPTQCS